MKRVFVYLVFLLLVPFAALGAAYELMPGTYLEFELPGDRWQVSDTPPDFLVKVARKNLSINELFVVNPQSGAWLAIDFSPLREGENSPGRRRVARSAPDIFSLW